MPRSNAFTSHLENVVVGRVPMTDVVLTADPQKNTDLAKRMREYNTAKLTGVIHAAEQVTDTEFRIYMTHQGGDDSFALHTLGKTGKKFPVPHGHEELSELVQHASDSERGGNVSNSERAPEHLMEIGAFRGPKLTMVQLGPPRIGLRTEVCFEGKVRNMTLSNPHVVDDDMILEQRNQWDTADLAVSDTNCAMVLGYSYGLGPSTIINPSSSEIVHTGRSAALLGTIPGTSLNTRELLAMQEGGAEGHRIAGIRYPECYIPEYQNPFAGKQLNLAVARIISTLYLQHRQLFEAFGRKSRLRHPLSITGGARGAANILNDGAHHLAAFSSPPGNKGMRRLVRAVQRIQTEKKTSMRTSSDIACGDSVLGELWLANMLSDPVSPYTPYQEGVPQGKNMRKFLEPLYPKHNQTKNMDHIYKLAELIYVSFCTRLRSGLIFKTQSTSLDHIPSPDFFIHMYRLAAKEAMSIALEWQSRTLESDVVLTAYSEILDIHVGVFNTHFHAEPLPTVEHMQHINRRALEMGSHTRLLSAAEVLMKNNNHQEALALLEPHYHTPPWPPMYLILLGRCYRKLNNNAKAKEVFTRAVHEAESLLHRSMRTPEDLVYLRETEKAMRIAAREVHEMDQYIAV